MAILGKRKAPEPSISEEDAQAIFRRHFEARFNPLPGKEAAAAEQPSSDEDEERDDEGDQHSSDGENSEWDGLSDDEASGEDDDDTPTIEVVDHSVGQPPKPTTTMTKRELKAFMSSRPPDQTTTPRPSISDRKSASSSSSALPEDAPSLLAQDLELRRLIAESHLLVPNRPISLSSISSNAASSATEPKTFSSGRIRQKTLDLRIQALGSKASILKQEKMPMNMRKGINNAAVERETRRRREAKENGVILEREASGNKKRRDRKGGGGGGFGVDRPGVGRLRGAELRISEHDVKRIEGTRDVFGGRGGKRR